MGLKGKARQRANKKERNRSINKKFLRNKSLRESIIKWDDPILKEICKEVSPEEDISDIVKKLVHTLKATKNGVGLSAPQIGCAKKIIAIRPNRVTNEVNVFINPSITYFSEEKEMGIEGCLSYPDFYYEVERSSSIKMDYVNEKFEPQNVEFSGTDARIAQHECDHLNGDCIVGKLWERSRGIGVYSSEDATSINQENSVTGQ